MKTNKKITIKNKFKLRVAILMVLFIAISIILGISHDLTWFNNNNKKQQILQKYLDDTYTGKHSLYIKKSVYYDGHSDYTEQRFWETPVFVCYVQDKNSQDTNFAIGLHEDYVYDSYDYDVSSMYNTRKRLNDELRKYINDYFIAYDTESDDFGGSYIYNSDNAQDYLYLDMPFNKDLPFEAEIYIYIKFKDYIERPEHLAKLIKIWVETAENIGLNINHYRIVDTELGWDKSYIFTPYEIKNMDLSYLIENLKTLNP